MSLVRNCICYCLCVPGNPRHKARRSPDFVPDLPQREKFEPKLFVKNITNSFSQIKNEKIIPAKNPNRGGVGIQSGNSM